jgi:hypothetical protein
MLLELLRNFKLNVSSWHILGTESKIKNSAFRIIVYQQKQSGKKITNTLLIYFHIIKI